MTARNTGYIVSRAFRGSTLYLIAYTAKPLSFHWSTSGTPHKFDTSAAALQAADKAAREYGAECAVKDAAGNLLQPKAARKPRYKVALTVRENAPSVYGIYDTHDRSQGFNGRLIDEWYSEEHANDVCAHMNGESAS